MKIDTSDLGFHWRAGIFFKRLPDGAVQLTIVDEQFEIDTGRHPEGDDPWVYWVIPAAEWVSIAASVSALGSTPEGRAAAQAQHGTATEEGS